LKEIKYYDINQSQEVVKLQCKYTLFKRIINIVTSMTSEKELDFDVMKKAYNKVVERNDCLRIKFVKREGKLMQYFDEYTPVEDIPVLEFATKEEQEAFINKKRMHAIKYLKGVVIEPYFIKTYDKKWMVLLKVCHFILDVYGINMIFKDLFEVYDALKNNKELPEKPGSFEEVVKKDLILKNNQAYNESNEKFFTEYLLDRPEPYYAGIHGPEDPIFKKKLKKNHRGQKMFIINCDTKGYMHTIDKETCDKVMEYCKANTKSPANFLMYAASITTSRLNGNVKNMLPLELCNCRATVAEKKCAGTKVQSLGCYTHIEHDKTFKENFEEYCLNQMNLSRHLGFPDMKFEMLLHKLYRSSMLETYYWLAYSFIPMKKPEGMEFQVYSNGKCALPCYVAQLYDVDTGEISMAYDVQIKTTSEEHVKKFHDAYVGVIKQILNNPDIKVSDIEV